MSLAPRLAAILAVVLLAATPLAIPQSDNHEIAPQTHAQQTESPLFFTSNAGQAPAVFDIVNQQRHQSVGFASDGAWIRVQEGSFRISPGFEATPELRANDVTVRHIRGGEILQPTAGDRVTYTQAGLQFEAYFNADGNLEFDHVLAPGTPVEAAILNTNVPFTIGKQLQLHLPAGDVALDAPFAYQHVQDERVPVAVSYTARGTDIGFEVGEYDPTRPLIIDPVLLASTYAGGTLLDEPTDIEVAPDGTVYVVGSTYSMDFPITDHDVLDRLQDPPLLPNDNFGFSLDAQGARLAVGAPGGRVAGVEAGLVYVYDANLNLLQTLQEPENGAHVPEAGDRFGHSVQYVGTTLFVGAPGDDSLVTDGGSIYAFSASGGFLFSVDAPGTLELGGGAPEPGQQFGWELARWGGNLATGSPFEDIVYQSQDIPDAGAVRLFDVGGNPLSGGLTNYWSEVLYLNSIPTQGDHYGYSLSAAGVELMIGSPGDRGLNPTDPPVGAVHVVNPANNPVGYFTAAGLGGERFGHSVAYMASSTLMIAGAPYDDAVATNAGAAYMLLPGCAPTVALVNNPGLVAGDLFGLAMAGGPNNFAIGSPYDEKGAPDSGAAYQWEASANPGCGGVDLTLSMEHPEPFGSDWTGSAIAYWGDKVVVGAHGTNLNFVGEGEVIIYDIEAKIFDSTKEETDQEGWIAHYESDGTLDFITYLGGSGDDIINGIDIDEEGNLYLGGGTSSPDFPIHGAPYMSGNQGLIVAKDTFDGFVTKMLPDGSDLLFSTYLGGYENDNITDIIVGIGNSVYVGGITDSGNFPIAVASSGVPVMQSSKQGEHDGFLARLLPDGSALYFSTYYGGSEDDFLNAIAVDEDGFVYAAGTTLSPDLPVLSIVQGGHANDAYTDGFFVKIRADGSFRPSSGMGDPGGPIYSGYLGGDLDEAIYDIALNEDKELHMVGQTHSAAVFEPRFPLIIPAFQDTREGLSDAFLSVLFADGRQLKSSTYLGGGNHESAHGIDLDAYGDIYIIGKTSSPDFPVVAPTHQAFRKGPSDAFLVKFQPDGLTQHFGTYYGGNGDEAGLTVAADLRGSVFTAGTSGSADLTLINEHQPSLFGMYDGFVAKFQDSAPQVDFTHDAGASVQTLVDIEFEDASIPHVDGDLVNFTFDFGDGNVSYGKGPHTHAYGKAGVYTVTLTVTTDSGLVISVEKAINVQNRIPTASFTYSPEDATDFHTVEFADESEDEDGEIDGWFWDFGDGSTSDEQNPTHQFTPGTYTVELTVFDDEWPVPGSSETYSQEITIRKGIQATPDFTMSPTNPSANAVVTFTDTSNDPDGLIESWHWDFGDGFEATGNQVTHQFTAKQIYTVTLTVTDNDGIEAVLTRDVDVSNKAPVADFSRSVTEPAAGDLVKFYDLSSDADGNVVSWNWDFHDGEVSQVPSPSHRFAVSDVQAQRVTLTVTDNDGATNTHSIEFWVRAPGNVGGGYVPSSGGGYQASTGGNVGADEDGNCPPGTLPEEGICTEPSEPVCPDNQFLYEGECVTEVGEEDDTEATPVTGYVPQRTAEPEKDEVPTGLWVTLIIMAALLLVVGAIVAILVVKRL